MKVFNHRFQTRCLSSLSKVFADEDLEDVPFHKASALHNETYSFQVAYYSEVYRKPLKVDVDSTLAEQITVRAVGLAPSELPYKNGPDEHVLRTSPGLYPDPLMPIDEEKGVVAFPGQWRSVWITVELEERIRPGAHTIAVSFEDADGERLGREVFELEVIPVSLPEQKLIHTEWFHADCLATHYNVEVFSEAHWRLIDRYVQTAVKHGMNMLLTPLFTPPLDTMVGGERPTVQLVEVEKREGAYSFRFDKLRRWIELGNHRGVRYFEFSHLFTQWGAKHCPKIMATANGEECRIFGWDTEAAGADYEAFLDQFLPELVQFIHEHQLENRCYFHISDEPRSHDLEQYRAVSKLMTKHLDGFKVMDALSDYSFYEQGAVKHPIPASNHIQPFIDNGVAPLWTYYCVSQWNQVSNRFFHMPSSRNRILGYQLYKFNVEGFLHWGYNFWYSQYSVEKLNPFVHTDAKHSFPSGDAFLVYPGDEGPIESIRMEVFYEGLQDMRALQLLEQAVGKERVLQLLEKDMDDPLTFERYPRSMNWLLQARAKINEEIKRATIGGSRDERGPSL
jgi:hypothetical protein